MSIKIKDDVSLGGSFAGNFQLNANPLKFNNGGLNSNLITTYAGDVNGAGTVIQSGGLMVLGGGESAGAYWSAKPDGGNAGTENLILTADSEIILRPGAQGGFDNTKKLRIDSTGELHLSGCGLTFPASPMSWIGGKTTGSALTITGDSSGSYQPIIRYPFVTGRVANLGAINDMIGFWGYHANTTANQTDSHAYLNISNNTFYCQNIMVGGTDLKKSVSDGKKSVADAITARGISTAANSDFSVLATNVRKLRREPASYANGRVRTMTLIKKVAMTSHISGAHGVVGRVVYNGVTDTFYVATARDYSGTSGLIIFRITPNYEYQHIQNLTGFSGNVYNVFIKGNELRVVTNRATTYYYRINANGGVTYQRTLVLQQTYKGTPAGIPSTATSNSTSGRFDDVIMSKYFYDHNNRRYNAYGYVLFPETSSYRHGDYAPTVLLKEWGYTSTSTGGGFTYCGSKGGTFCFITLGDDTKHLICTTDHVVTKVTNSAFTNGAQEWLTDDTITLNGGGTFRVNADKTLTKLSATDAYGSSYDGAGVTYIPNRNFLFNGGTAREYCPIFEWDGGSNLTWRSDLKTIYRNAGFGYSCDSASNGHDVLVIGTKSGGFGIWKLEY